jgi:hypothetical protein
MKTALLTLALAVGLQAETVYLSANGKTFHRQTACMALHRSKHVYQAERADAEKHGLHSCSICYREKTSVQRRQTKGANVGWAKEVGNANER